MIPLLSTLAVAAQAFVVIAILAGAFALIGVKKPLRMMHNLVAKDALRLALLVAFVATAGSLYFSEVKHFTPCALCWYQRIFMYPLVVVLGVAVLENNVKVWRTAVPLSLLGMCVSIYHYQLELFPGQESIVCSKDIPCSAIWFREFGYITIAMMALSGFALITTLLLFARKKPEGV